jgi:tetratricopeptide (TPR) repeat protein
VQLGAVIGRRFTRTWLSALLGRDDAVLTRDLEELMEAGVLQQQEDEQEPTDAFRHALIQEAAHDSLPPRPKRQHHARIARFLHERFPEVIDSQPEMLAHHYTESGDLEEALRYWRQAGERAVQRSAHLEAICHLTRALEVFELFPDKAGRRRLELQLLLALSTPMTVTHGYGRPEVEQLYARIHHLLPELEGEPEVGAALYGLFLNRFGQGRLHEAHAVADQLAQLGGQLRSPELLAMGHRLLATVLFTMGNADLALEHSRRAVENSRFMDTERHRELSVKLGLDQTVTALAYASIICSVTGRWSQARKISDEALRLAERIAHPATLALTYAYTASSCELRREDARWVLELARRGIECSTAHHFPMWMGWSTMLWGWAKVQLACDQQERNEGHVILQEGIERWRAAGMTAGWPYFLGLFADVLLKQGRAQEGLNAVAEGLVWVERTGERSSEAELHRLQGELLWATGARVEALSCLQRALAVARRQAARTFELRAAVSLGRRLLDLGRREEARKLLESSSMGFETEPVMADFAEARALLERLSLLDPVSPMDSSTV